MEGKGPEDSLLVQTHPISFLNLDVMLCAEEKGGLILDAPLNR